MTYVVEPLFAEWGRFSDTRLSQTMLGHLGLNKASWGGLVQQEGSTSPEELEPSSPAFFTMPTPAVTESEPESASEPIAVTTATATGETNYKEIPQGSKES